MNTGIYEIKCKENGKSYIGSTRVSFAKRIYHHFLSLENKTHKNKHLQNAFDKYGYEAFEFSILQRVPKNQCLAIEQKYIDSRDWNMLFNINPLATDSIHLTSKQLQDRGKSLREFNKKARKYFKQVKASKLRLKDVPEKYQKQVSKWLKPVWNTGKKMSKAHNKKLSAAAKTRKISQKGRKQRQKAFSARVPDVYVYNQSKTLLGKYTSAAELERQSLKKSFELIDHMILRNPNGRNGLPAHILRAPNVNKATKTGKPYKGLLFSVSPLS